MREAIKNAEKYRHSNDMVGELSTPISYQLDLIENNLARNSLSIQKELVPKVEKALVEVCENLLLDRNTVKGYINSSHDLQAYCYSINQEECIIQISSRLIELLEENELKFVFGHEIGHFLLGHGLVHLDENQINMYSTKFQELSADRIGVLASNDEQAGYRAIIKTASGLSSDHLKFNVSRFLSQLNDANLIIGEDIKNTHPSLLIRCKAILWFNIFLKQNYSQNEKIKLDNQIDNDLAKYLDGPLLEKRKELKETYEIWYVVSLILKDNRFDKKEQQLIEEKFGKDTLMKIKNLISNSSLDELNSFITNKLESAREEIKKFDRRLLKELESEFSSNYSFL